VLHNVQANVAGGFDVLNIISEYTDGCLSCFFIEPDVLWCGLLYSQLAVGNEISGRPKVEFRMGFNIVRDNDLKLETAGLPVEVKYSKRLPTGAKISKTSDVFKTKKKDYQRVLNHLKDAKSLGILANEKSYQLNYAGYSGFICAFLQPFVQPGDVARLTDEQHPERDGDYIVESTEVKFGISGARRKVELGAKVGFAKS
jgi:hypothetical protein